MNEAEPLKDLFWSQAPCGFVETDHRGLVTRVNGTLLDWLRMSEKQIVHSQRMIDLFTPGSQMYFDTVAMPKLLMAGEVQQVALELKCQHGQPLSIFLSARRQLRGETTALQFALVDATERRRYERELLAANEALQRTLEERNKILGMVVHDLRTPLAGIMGLASLLEGKHQHPQAAEYLGLIQTSGNNMLALINDLLDLSSANDGKLSMELNNADLGEMVGQVAAILSPMARIKGIDIVFENPSTAMMARCDSARLMQALSNLLANAIKFSPSGNPVVIGIEQQSSHFDISVADRGPGIAADEIERLFQPFAVGRARPTGGEHSSGLGLAIVARIAEAHGGTITVDQHQGGGAIFTLRIPRAE